MLESSPKQDHARAARANVLERWGNDFGHPALDASKSQLVEQLAAEIGSDTMRIGLEGDYFELREKLGAMERTVRKPLPNLLFGRVNPIMKLAEAMAVA